MNIFRSQFIVALILLSFTTQAQYLEFVENKGQWHPNVKYQANFNGGSIFLEAQGYKMLLHNAKDLSLLSETMHPHATSQSKDTTHPHRYFGNPPNSDRITLRSHAYEAKFVNANSQSSIVGEKTLPNFNNYFVGNDSSKWTNNCKIHQAITYKNIYPGIDVRYYTDNGSLKYDIIVNPGADPDQIALQFDGVDKLSLKNGNLFIQTSVEEVKELKPYTFQSTSSGRQEIGSAYQLQGNIVKFQLSDYDKSFPLIIDPSVVFSTFTGSSADNWGYTATFDTQGNFYAGGIVFGNGFPVSNGAFQTIFQGGVTEGGSSGYDIGIIKFSPDGVSRLYATYIGGSNNEQPHSLFADNAGNLVIAGRTASANYPTTLSTVGPGGGYDILITKLNASGNGLIASRKFGGAAADGVNIVPKSFNQSPATITIRRNYGDDARSEVILDGAGNIYVASCTQSSNFPVINATQVINNGGGINQDGVVIKTSPDLSTVFFSTYLGGSGDDAAFVLALNPTNGDVYVAGGTTSTDFPGDHSSTIFPTYQNGPSDGFVSVLSSNGGLGKTGFFGTPGADIIYGIQFDNAGFPYITGTTTGDWPITPNTPTYSAGSRHFISKLRPDLSDWVYSTVFGKGATANPSLSITAFLVDQCENVYVSGWGGGINSPAYVPQQSTSNLPVTPDAIQAPPNEDGSDFYFFVLEKNATKQLYGSYFGQVGGIGEHVDGGTSRFDKQGVIYQAICANCGGSPKPKFPTTPGVWSENNPSNNCNLAAVKIAFNFSGVQSGLKAFINAEADTSGCVPLTVQFRDTVGTGKTFVWDFGDGTPEQTTTQPDISHTYTQIGTYNVRLISIDPSTCNIRDTSYTNIRVRNDEATVGFTNTKLPPCESLSYQFTNTSLPSAGKSFSLTQSFVWDFGDGTSSTDMNPPVHNYPAPGTYIVRLSLIDTNFCNAPVTISATLNIAANVVAQFQTPPTGCAPYQAVFTNTSIGGQQFTWDLGDGTTSTTTNPTHLYTNPGTYAIKLTAVDNNTCNITDDTTVTITVNPSPTSDFVFDPNPPQENVPTTFTNTSLNGVLYKWYFGDGDSVITTRRDTIIKHSYNETLVYNACLVTINSFGCPDTVCKPISALVFPILDVPNAFTPNGDGINDQVHVQGFGIRTINWQIFNRWGRRVFQTSNFRQGWDGKFKGVIQPQDVYTYVLDIEFVDRKKHRKTGDITLLR